MIYAQFFQRSAVDRTKLVEACGDFGVVILDGRSPSRHRTWAEQECRARGYLGWQLMKGERFTTARAISELVEV